MQTVEDWHEALQKRRGVLHGRQSLDYYCYGMSGKSGGGACLLREQVIQRERFEGKITELAAGAVLNHNFPRQQV
jgi:hypothetical protein